MLFRAGDDDDDDGVDVASDAADGVDEIMAASVGSSNCSAAGWLAVFSDCGFGLATAYLRCLQTSFRLNGGWTGIRTPDLEVGGRAP